MIETMNAWSTSIMEIVGPFFGLIFSLLSAGIAIGLFLGLLFLIFAGIVLAIGEFIEWYDRRAHCATAAKIIRETSIIKMKDGNTALK